ncbi:MAG TPA: DNA/RNA non-specific endonuclease [Williamwhitmania sp.]|nr:DNA/RNA non-specific endonuclease [Williamwhitmania sp.]
MKKLLLLAAMVAVFASCSKDDAVTPQVTNESSTLMKATSSATVETFESGTKTAYTAGAVTFSTGSWYLDDALVGTSTSDRKNDTKSVRIRNTGKLTAQFDYTTGISTVSVNHAVYGTDGSSTWELYYSTNSGSSWTKAGSTITSSSTSLATVTFTINQSGNVRIDIRKVSGGTNRINIDNVSVSPYSSGDTGGGTTGPATRDDNMGMGNPSNATTSTSNYTNYLMVKSEYALSYNRDKGTANWVSWHLSTAWLGSASRPSSFTTDATLPSGWYQVTTSNYTNTGFDRGHLCAAADRSYSTTAITNTMKMTNIMPQAPINNQQPWAALEDYCRTLANAGNELYIIDGPYGSGGTGSNGGTTTTIASGKVTVPSNTWKVILILPNGTNDPSRVTSSTRVIAVWMPNTQSIVNNWGQYRTTVDYIESKTGYDFFSNVSTSVQSVIESKVDSGPTN